jgi:hypothetical protein
LSRRSMLGLLLVMLAGGCDPMDDLRLDGGVLIDGGDQGNGDSAVIEDGGFEPLRLNHMQVRGTVNSYHDSRVPPEGPELAYWHLPLDQQAAVQGIRQFDFDVYGNGISLGVQHIGGIGDRFTLCERLLPCLDGIAAWSDVNPDHPPLVILMGETWTWPDIDVQFYWHVDEIEEYLLAAFGRERMLSPSDVRGGHPDLATAIAAHGWPTIDEARGKIIAVLNEHNEARASTWSTAASTPPTASSSRLATRPSPRPTR